MIEIKNLEKKEYVPPVFEVEFIEMESGVAAASAFVTVSTGEANVSTVWDGEDTIVID